jgi:hypothetical protein
MYQDFLMKFAQQQQSPLQKNLLQSNPLLHQVNFLLFIRSCPKIQALQDFFSILKQFIARK